VVVAGFKYLPISFEKREWAGKILPMILKNTAPWEYNPVAFLFVKYLFKEKKYGTGKSSTARPRNTPKVV
jgi:hypothetical protein